MFFFLSFGMNRNCSEAPDQQLTCVLKTTSVSIALFLLLQSGHQNSDVSSWYDLHFYCYHCVEPVSPMLE